MTTYHVPCDPTPFNQIQAGTRTEFILDFRSEPGDILIINEKAKVADNTPAFVALLNPRPFTGRQQRVRVLACASADRQNQILSGTFTYTVELASDEKREPKTHDHVRCGHAPFELILSGSVSATVETLSDPVNFGDFVIFKEVANEGSLSPLYTGRQLKVKVTSVDPLDKALARPAGEQGFSFTLVKEAPSLLSEAEQRAILSDPRGLACLMAFHDIQYTEASSCCGGLEQAWPVPRYTELKAMGAAIIAPDPECFPDDLCREFGIPVAPEPAIIEASEGAHVPAPKSDEAAVDTALGLIELPPIRVDAETASRMYTTARLAGVVVQEVVRQRLDDFYSSDKKEFNPLQQLRDFGWSLADNEGGDHD